MLDNPILDELYETRDLLLNEAGGTIEAPVAKLQRDERRSGRQFVRHNGSTERDNTVVVPGMQTMEIRLMQPQ